ncbi:MAG TPA: DegT/DnrJ/EryC1/StrS family aminotransferase [Bacteroidia bacterium]
MNVPFVDLHTQYLSIKKEIDSAISSVIDQSAYIGGGGNHFVAEFENSFANYIGVDHCISCANGTDSLEILLKSFGIGVGDEVIVPALSWISTSEAVSNVGAVPIFADISPDKYTIDANRVLGKISSSTKAIIPVHLYGLPAEMDEILAVARKYRLIVIEDCAQAHGAEYRGKKVGSIGDAASFSFYPGKNLGAYGDAGCMMTNDKAIADRSRMIANHGQLQKHQHQMEGRNSRLDGLQAAVLGVKLKYLDMWNNLRRKNANLYRTYLKNDQLLLQNTPEYSKHVYHIFSVQTDRRDEVIDVLQMRQVRAAIHYPVALPFLDAYKHFGFYETDFPVAKKVASSTLSLPMFPELSEDAIKYVASLLT